MQKKTIEKYEGILDSIIKSGLTIPAYFALNNETSLNTFYNQMNNVAKGAIEDIEIRERLLQKYEIAKGTNDEKLSDVSEEELDNGQQSEVANIRNKDGKIIYYQYKIFKKNKRPLQGKLTCEEMNTIYRLYTYYGDNLTARVVSRHFPDFSLPDFKRILRAFNVYKDSGSFAPHMYEEYTEDELRDIQLREKENSFLRKAEEDNIKNDRKLLRKLGLENVELKKQLEQLTNIKLDIENIEPYIVQNSNEECDTAINIYLSDVHLGACVETGSLYDENNNYGFDEAKRRLQVVVEKLCDLRTTFDVLNLCLMGDNIDCAGFANYTGSMTHQMPENMDPRDQFNKFIELYDWFIRTLAENNIFDKKINVYSVPTGNHGSNYEYALNSTLKYYTEARFPDINFTLFDKFFGTFEQNGVTFLLTHGKDGKFMKKGMPLNLDDKNKVKIYEWLDDNKIYGDNIHIIKGDLHSNNLNSCKRFTYRNVLSLFGASDYSSYGFSRNSYGLSYDIIVGDNVISGTFENI